MLPFEDIRVVSFEQYGAGPWATMQLADLGADVIKIEDPASDGDSGRYVPPFRSRGSSLFFETFNRNKQSLTLDLRHPESRGVLEDLVRRSDAVFANLRGDQPKKLGLTYESLGAVNARIVCCFLSSFGMTGPRGHEGGYDYTIQGITGWMSLTGGPAEPPAKSGLPLVDLSAGYVAALAMLAGIWQARLDGRGRDCDLSLYDTALAELIYVGTWAASNGFQPPRLPDSAHISMVPFQTFETADGRIIIACPKQSLWVRLCDALEQLELAADLRFLDPDLRLEHRDELVEILAVEFRTRDTQAWLEILRAHGVPTAPVNSVSEALEDPQAAARRSVVELDHPELGTVRQMASPLRLDGVSTPLRRAPLLGEQTREILRDVCGYSEDRIDALGRSGALGEAWEPDRSLA